MEYHSCLVFSSTVMPSASEPGSSIISRTRPVATSRSRSSFTCASHTCERLPVKTGLAVQRRVPERTARRKEVVFSSPTALFPSEKTFKAAPVLHRCLYHACVHASVHYPVGLKVPLVDFYFSNELVPDSLNEMKAHRLVETANKFVNHLHCIFRKIFHFLSFLECFYRHGHFQTIPASDLELTGFR